MLICKDCENKTDFSRTVEGTTPFSSTQHLDMDEDVINTEEEPGDDLITNMGVIICDDCKSANVQNVPEPEWRRWKGPELEDKQGYETWRGYLHRTKPYKK